MTASDTDRDVAELVQLVAPLLEQLIDQLARVLAARVDARLDELRAERADGRVALDIAQAAARLGVSTRSVRRLMETGVLETLRIGRRRLINAAALEALLDSGELDTGERGRSRPRPAGCPETRVSGPSARRALRRVVRGPARWCDQRPGFRSTFPPTPSQQSEGAIA